MTRVRVRRDATFMPWEVNDLWVHEVETHALSAVNGSRCQLLQRSRSCMPAMRAIRSSSAGHT